MTMKDVVFLLTLMIIIGCAESSFESTRTPSLSKHYIQVSQKSLSCESKKSTISLMVSSEETPWTLDLPCTWASANITSSSQSEKVNITVNENNSADTSRVCVATIKSSVPDWNKSISIILTQSKATPIIECSQKIHIIDARTQQLKIAVESNVDYSVSNSNDWITFNEKDNKTISLTIFENKTGAERTGKIMLSSVGVSETITITQRAANISTSVQTVNFTYEASSKEIEIESDASWTANSSQWISISPTAGDAGTSTILITVPSNLSASERKGFVYITLDPKKLIEIPVSQSGITCEVSTNALSFSSDGERKTFDIISNYDWEITSYPSWLTISQVSGHGNTTIAVDTNENNTTNENKGTIVVSTQGGLIQRTINVQQSGKTVDVNLHTIEFGYNGGAEVFNFRTDGRWSAFTDSEWLKIDRTSGIGGTNITIIATANNTISERNGKVILTIAGEIFEIDVHQDCKYLTLSSSAFEFTSAMGYTNISIASNSSWLTSIQDNVNWLIVKPEAGFGNAELTIGVSENNTPYERTGTVQVEIPYVQTYLININQAGKYLKTDRESIDFTSAGGTISFNVITDGTYEVSKSGTWFGFTRNGDIINVIAPANTTGMSRTGEIVLHLTNLSEGSKSITLLIKQSAQ